ncbi:MAG TPA: fibronectin type III domain-containing protein, partial [Bacteroidales bacterium]|nr:fibronectin type III domain-containing protein [Bacteroidales bacterium]
TGNNNFIAIRHNTVLNNWYYWIDDVTIDYIPACARPSQLNASNIQAYSADISWNPGNVGDAAWWLYYKEGNETDYDSVYVNTLPPYTLPGLVPSTTYNYYLRTDCGVEVSEESSIESFSTPCVPITTLPWTESFEGIAVADEMPACMAWSGTTGKIKTYLSAQTYNRSARTGTKFLTYTWGCNNYVYTPGFELQAGINYEFSFWYKADGNTGFGPLKAELMSDQLPTSVISPIGTPVPANIQDTAYTQYQGTFAPTADGVYYIGIHLTGTGTSPWYLTIDDLSLEQGGTPCLPPTNITVTPSNISATVTWTAGGGEASWEVRLGETGTPETVSSTNHSLSGLTPNTTYTVYVRGNCGESYSSWIPTQFTTTTDPTPPIVTTAVPTTLITQTTAVFNGEYVETSSPILTKGFEYKEATSNDWTEQEVIDGTTPFTFTATGLTSSTDYQAKAYVNTATDGRVYGNTINFTTLVTVPPTVTTDSVRVITETSATFYGKIIENTEAIEARGFEYKLITEDWDDAINISATGITEIFATATTLTNGMTYEVRAYGRTLSGKAYGLPLTFAPGSLNGVIGQDISIMMYPNPATSQTNLVVSGINGETKIVLS